MGWGASRMRARNSVHSAGLRDGFDNVTSAAVASGWASRGVSSLGLTVGCGADSFGSTLLTAWLASKAGGRELLELTGLSLATIPSAVWSREAGPSVGDACRLATALD